MTNSNRRFHQWTNSSNDPETEALDDCLNAHVVSDGLTDAGQMHDSDSLTASADAFHRRMEMAQERRPGAGSPDPGLWERVIGEHEKEADMSTNVRAVNAGQREWDTPAVPNVAPAPRKTSWWDSRIVNVIAAGLLIVAIGAGYWFSGIGPGGGGSGDDPRRFAAQALTPEASPESGLPTCNVEPLAEDEVIDMVRDPAGWIERESNGVADVIPEQVSRDNFLFAFPELGEPLLEEQFGDVTAVVNTYIACAQSGSLPQMMALQDPHSVRMEVNGGRPGTIPEENIDFFVGQKMDNPAEWSFAGLNYEMSDYVFLATTDINRVRVRVTPSATIAYVGTDTFDRDGRLVQTTDWMDQREIASGNESDNASFGTVTLVKYPGIDRWFVHDTIVRLMNPPAATPVAVMPSEQRQG